INSWQLAVDRSDGWDAAVITQKTLEAALQVRDGVVEWEQDTIVSRKILYSPAILALIILALARSNERLSIVDFGGNLATNYFQNRKILEHLAGMPVTWSIVERQILVD